MPFLTNPPSDGTRTYTAEELLVLARFTRWQDQVLHEQKEKPLTCLRIP